MESQKHQVTRQAFKILDEVGAHLDLYTDGLGVEVEVGEVPWNIIIDERGVAMCRDFASFENPACYEIDFWGKVTRNNRVVDYDGCMLDIDPAANEEVTDEAEISLLCAIAKAAHEINSR